MTRDVTQRSMGQPTMESAVKDLKEGRTVAYKSRFGEGRGKIIEIYERANGRWLIVHDKERNKSVSIRPGQVLA